MQKPFPRFRVALLTLPFAPALLAQTAFFTVGRSTVQVINPATQTQVASLFAGANPTAIVSSLDGNTIYVADAASQSVTIIDAVHNTVQAQASVGQPLNRLAVSADGLYLYFVSSSLTYNNVLIHPAVVTKFDLSTKKTVLSATLSQTGTTYSVSVSADGSKLYIPLQSKQGIAVLDTATLTIQSVIHVSKNAGPAVVAGTTAWMLCGDAICRIDLTTGALINTSAGNYGGSPFCLSPDLTKLYVFPAAGFVYVLDAVALTVEQQIANSYQGQPRQVLVSPDGKTLYVANVEGIAWYDTQTYTLQGGTNVSIGLLQAFSVSASNMIFQVEGGGAAGNCIGVLNLADDKISSEIQATWFANLSISPDGSTLYGSDLEELVSLNLAPKSTPASLVSGGTSVIGYSTDGTLLYLNTLYGTSAGIDSVSVATGQIVNHYGYIGNSEYGQTAVISPDATKVYFASYATPVGGPGFKPTGIYVLDTTTFSAQAVSSYGFLGANIPVAISPDGTKLFVEGLQPGVSTNNLIIYDLTVGTFSGPQYFYPSPIFPFASSFAFGPKDIAFYGLTQDFSGNLTFTAFDPNTLAVLHSYPLGPNSGSFAISSDETHAYITLSQSRSILDLNLPSFIVHATIPTGFAPGAIVISPK